jgi:hypothetical protein
VREGHRQLDEAALEAAARDRGPVTFEAPRRRVEVPRGSGRFAYYTAAEEAFMRELLAAGAGAGEVVFMHELKVVFGADLGGLLADTPCEAEQPSLLVAEP